jgi:predicted MFS family arabinose efflux permease
LLLVATLGGFTGYVLLLPVVPLWAVVGGAGEIAAGATNAVFMLVTVLTQLAMPWLLRRVGHRLALGLGCVLIGAPTPLFAVSAQLWALLGVSGLRGIGFGLLTVSGSALVAELVPAGRRGRAAGLYGLAVGLPNVVFLPAGVWLSQQVGFVPLFWIACAVPIVATCAIPGMSPVGARPVRAAVTPSRTRSIVLLPPWVVMAVASVAAGGIIAFLPLAIVASVASVGLMVFGASMVIGRWLAGLLVDRVGSRRTQLPALLTAGIGMVIIAIGAAGPTPLALLGALGLGVGFGALQNGTLVAMFERAESGSASTAWNVAYDAGSGLGAIGFGLLITAVGYPATFAVVAALVLCCAPLAAARGRWLRG